MLKLCVVQNYKLEPLYLMTRIILSVITSQHRRVRTIFALLPKVVKLSNAPIAERTKKVGRRFI